MLSIKKKTRNPQAKKQLSFTTGKRNLKSNKIN